nr:tRNA preQ1(34) S-adenosylmethionine ribosyltransferase-isomerase QueA [Limnochorda pilosa]
MDAFDYHLPPGAIAQEPVEPRDASRLLVLRREDGRLEHRIFRDLPEYLAPGDVLVVNESRVRPARLIGEKEGTGGAVELLLLRPDAEGAWECLARPGRRLRAGQRLVFGGGRLRGQVVDPRVPRSPGGEGPSRAAGVRRVRFEHRGPLEQVLEELGRVPLPPYIHRELADPERYQTVYARETGSAAAPTAGLHFTPELLDRIRSMGVVVAPVVLHVGLDTFRPVTEQEAEEHPMHREYYAIPAETAAAVEGARARGGRVVAVGTTSVRALEAAAIRAEGLDPAGDRGAAAGRVPAGSGWTDLYIYPGYRFRAVDALVTNFHLPRSTLLLLVSAFAGRERVLEAYRVAVEAGYRFFSFGDAMVIL